MKMITLLVFCILAVIVCFSYSREELSTPQPIQERSAPTAKPLNDNPKTVFSMTRTLTTENLVLTAPSLDNFKGEIDWGDGTKETYRVTLSHVYRTPGNFTVRLTGISTASKLEIEDLSDVYLLDLSKL